VRKKNPAWIKHLKDDDDVNVYLAHLLFAFLIPEYHDMAKPYVSSQAGDILNTVHQSNDKTFQYFVFKVNADHLLMQTSILKAEESKERKTWYRKHAGYYRELAKLYYSQASAYHKKIYRKKSGVGPVLEKLSQHFESYQRLLQEVKKDYFNFASDVKQQLFDHFMVEIKKYEKDYLVKEKTDSFLDWYGRWLSEKDPESQRQVIRIAFELRQLDPEFHFDPKEHFKINRGDEDNRECA